MTRGDPLVIMDHMLIVISEHDAEGGATINDLAEVGLSKPQLRRYLRELIDQGLIVRNQPMGPGTTYRLSGPPRRRVTVTVKEKGRKLGEFDLDDNLLHGLVGDRKLLGVARQVMELVGVELGSSAYTTRRRNER